MQKDLKIYQMFAARKLHRDQGIRNSAIVGSTLQCALAKNLSGSKRRERMKERW